MCSPSCASTAPLSCARDAPAHQSGCRPCLVGERLCLKTHRGFGLRLVALNAAAVCPKYRFPHGCHVFAPKSPSRSENRTMPRSARVGARNIDFRTGTACSRRKARRGPRIRTMPRSARVGARNMDFRTGATCWRRKARRVFWLGNVGLNGADVCPKYGFPRGCHVFAPKSPSRSSEIKI